jgi:16S rRNA processing protein RimM
VLVVIGRIVRAHGIRGEVVVDVRTDEPTRRFQSGTTLRAGARSLTIRSSRPHGGRLLVAFDEVSDRNVAEELRGTVLECEVDPAQAPEADEEYYDRQLVGLSVHDAGGRAHGIVTGVLHLPAQDTLVVGVDGREVLVPFVAELVPQVDVAAGFIRVADVAGLLSPEESE